MSDVKSKVAIVSLPESESDKGFIYTQLDRRWRAKLRLDRPVSLGAMNTYEVFVFDINDDYPVFCIYDPKNDLNCGYATFWANNASWNVERMAFAPEYQGFGLGAKFYTWLLNSGVCKILVSGHEQSRGGRATWEQLAKAPGIFVYGWDEQSQTAVSLDPNDLSAEEEMWSADDEEFSEEYEYDSEKADIAIQDKYHYLVLVAIKGSKTKIANAAFDAWFSGSKVINPDGTPMVMYHSTFSDIDIFKPATHFGTQGAANERQEHLTEFFDQIGNSGRGSGANIMPVYLSIKNPLRMPDLATIDQNGQPMREEGEESEDDFDNDIQFVRGWEYEDAIAMTCLEKGIFTIDEYEEHYYNEEAIKCLQAKGYDGIVYTNAVEDKGQDSWIAFRSNQVKSAIGNSGAYDPNDHSIRASQQKRGAYTAYVLTEAAHNMLLEKFPPKFPDVIAHHVTYQFGVAKDAVAPPEATIIAEGYASDDSLEAVVVSVDGQTTRPDGSTYHITLSLDKSKGRKPVDSNKVIKERGWTPLEQKFDIQTKAQKLAMNEPKEKKAATIGVSADEVRVGDKVNAYPKPFIVQRIVREGDELVFLGKGMQQVRVGIDDSVQIAMKKIASEVIKLFRGETTHNRGGNFWSPDPDFAMEFTQSGQKHELLKATIKASDIYKADPLPFAGSEAAMDAAFEAAKAGGFKAVWCSEGAGYSPSVFVFNRSSIKRASSFTDTPAFKAWFAGSKIVTKNGQPMPMYHGTLKDVVEGDTHVITYFTPKPEYANTFSGTLFHGQPNDEPWEGAKSIPVYLSMKHPFDIRVLGEDRISCEEFERIVGANSEERAQLEELYLPASDNMPFWKFVNRYRKLIKKILTRQGYDGIIQVETNSGETSDAYVVFEPNQIKSAIGNNGGFDPKNKSITASKRIRAFHGTTAKFDTFQCPAMFNVHRKYAEDLIAGNPNGHVIEAILTFEKTADLDAMHLSPSAPNFKEIAAKLEAEGYDSAQYKNQVWIAFKPEQIQISNSKIVTLRGIDGITPEDALYFARSNEAETLLENGQTIESVGESEWNMLIAEGAKNQLYGDQYGFTPEQWAMISGDKERKSASIIKPNVMAFYRRVRQQLGLQDFKEPVTQIENNPSSQWLGRCIWNIGDEECSILIQERVLGDDHTLMRVLAHEVCHEAANLLHWLPTIEEEDEFDILSAVQKVEDAMKQNGEHGSVWKEYANKVNSFCGQNFVTEKSDFSFVVDRKKAALPSMEDDKPVIDSFLLALQKALTEIEGTFTDGDFLTLFSKVSQGTLTGSWSATVAPANRALKDYVRGGYFSPNDNEINVKFWMGISERVRRAAITPQTEEWSQFANAVAAVLIHEHTHLHQFRAVFDSAVKKDKAPYPKIQDTTKSYVKLDTETGEGMKAYLAHQLEIAANARAAVEEIRSTKNSWGSYNNQSIFNLLKHKSLWGTMSRLSRSFDKYYSNFYIGWNRKTPKERTQDMKVMQKFVAACIKALPPEDYKPVDREGYEMMEELSPSKFSSEKIAGSELTVYHVSNSPTLDIDPNHKPKSGGVGVFYVTEYPEVWKDTLHRKYTHAYKVDNSVIARGNDWPTRQQMIEWGLSEGYLSMQGSIDRKGQARTWEDGTPMLTAEETEKAKSLPFYGMKDPMRGGGNGMAYMQYAYLKAHGFKAVESVYSPDGQEIAVFDTSCLKPIKTASLESWFSGSKVVNQDGSPKVVYHGTGANIETFSYDFTNQGNDQLGSGFYFTDHADTASRYTSRHYENQPKPGGENPNVMPVYLSIKKPITVVNGKAKEASLTIAQVRKIMLASPVLEDALSNFGDVEYEGQEKVIRSAAETYQSLELLRQLFALANDFYPEHVKEFNEAVYKTTGYDGIIAPIGSDSIWMAEQTHYVAWFPNQIKSAIGNSGNYDPNDHRVTASLENITYKWNSRSAQHQWILRAFEEDYMVGHLLLEEDAYEPTSVFVANVDVDSSYQRRGIALSLYRKAIAFAQKKGYASFHQGTPRTPDAAGVWAKLASEFKVEQDENGDVIYLSQQGKTGAYALYIEVPKSARDHFWDEPPEHNYEFWAFRSRPQALKGEKIIFTFDKKPVAESIVAFVEAPNKSKCDLTGKFEKHWKVYWNPKDFKKYKTKKTH